MKTVDKDRNSLKRLVEDYGKEDVMNYVNHLDEYMLGGNDWGDHTYNDNYYRKYGLANEDEIPYPAMNSLWFLGFFADKFRTILSNNLDPRKDNNPDVRGMRMQEIEYWDKVLDPIAGLMSNKTNIEGDDHQITKQDVLQYRSIYEKLLTSPVNLLKSSAQQLINFCKEISDSRRVGESVKTDRNTLKALVEAYGKEDVVNYINHLDEGLGTFVRKTVSGGKCEELAKQIDSMASPVVDSVLKTFNFTRYKDGTITYSTCSDPRRKEAGKKLLQRALDLKSKARNAKNGEKVSLDNIKKELDWIKSMLPKWQK